MCAALALDLGSRTGFALRRDTGRVESGEIELGNSDEGEGMRFLRFRQWLHDTKRAIEAAGETLDLILYERVDFHGPGVRATQMWGAMWGTLVAWACHHRITCKGVPVATIKKSATGKGNAKKHEMVAAVRGAGFAPASHNEADAIALLLTGGYA